MHGPIVDPPISIELNDDEMSHLENLKNEELNDELKHNCVREYLKLPVIV